MLSVGHGVHVHNGPPHVLAFAATGTPLDTKTIPESYILLRDVLAAALLDTAAIGALVPIDDDQIRELERKFLGESG